MKNQYLGSEFSGKEMYSSGWRGAPAKGVGRATGARVQIPPSPFNIRFKNNLNLVLTNHKPCGNISKLFEMSKSLKQFKKLFQKLLKKCLTLKMSCVRITKSLAKAATSGTEVPRQSGKADCGNLWLSGTLIIKQWNNPENSMNFHSKNKAN